MYDVDLDADGEGEQPRSAPAWIITFADLMSLLVCFFVLLLSFSKMDVEKYRQMVASMSTVFGDGSPTAGPPLPIPVEQPSQPSARVKSSEPVIAAGDQGGGLSDSARAALLDKVRAMQEATQQQARALVNALQSEIARGEIEVQTRGRQIIIRVREKGSFASGSAELAVGYRAVMARMRDVLSRREGEIAVVGHSDDVPIATSRFRSNWELSSARAISVAHELMAERQLDPRRFSVVGYGDTRPLAANDTPENRARNRRVEVIVQPPLDQATRDALDLAREQDPALYRQLRVYDDVREGGEASPP